MSAVYNPEADTIARIEQLERDLRETRRKVEHAINQADKRVLIQQLSELGDEIRFLRDRVG